MIETNKYSTLPINEQVKSFIKQSLESELKVIINLYSTGIGLLTDTELNLKTMFILPTTRKELRTKATYLKQLVKDLAVVRMGLENSLLSLEDGTVDPRTLMILEEASLLSKSSDYRLSQGWNVERNTPSK